MFLLDTDMLTLLAHSHSHSHRKAEAVAVTRKPLAISVITRIEILRGRFDFMMKAADKAEWLRAQHLLNLCTFRLHRRLRCGRGCSEKSTVSPFQLREIWTES